VLSKVGTGYSFDELTMIRERLRDNWTKVKREQNPSYITGVSIFDIFVQNFTVLNVHFNGFEQFRVPGQPMPTLEWPDLWVIDPHK
jgi:ATP-dependent DNA ligase